MGAKVTIIVELGGGQATARLVEERAPFGANPLYDALVVEQSIANAGRSLVEQVGRLRGDIRDRDDAPLSVRERQRPLAVPALGVNTGASPQHEDDDEGESAAPGEDFARAWHAYRAERERGHSERTGLDAAVLALRGGRATRAAAPDCPVDDPDCEGAFQLDPDTACHDACEPPAESAPRDDVIDATIYCGREIGTADCLLEDGHTGRCVAVRDPEAR